ncbi:GDSL esterase/lipase At5g03610-like isoform X2 [Triticum urartu]|uniref:GDSL esterase/lipase At5g03610-like isoform X2 n=1 Tax=Triticum urartu TaxID=4572 RepID=UPI002043BAA6|nr:GDSL esterase/lipase At5g03610-like isoform X2 [Triticum urartu]
MDHRRSCPPSAAAAGALLCLAMVVVMLSPATAVAGCSAGGERVSEQQGRSRGRHHRKHEVKEQLWVFGDSYTDTGNLGNLGRELTHAWYDPYGRTFPPRPAGRFSNGRVLTDFVATLAGEDVARRTAVVC